MKKSRDQKSSFLVFHGLWMVPCASVIEITQQWAIRRLQSVTGNVSESCSCPMNERKESPKSSRTHTKVPTLEWWLLLWLYRPKEQLPGWLAVDRPLRRSPMYFPPKCLPLPVLVMALIAKIFWLPKRSTCTPNSFSYLTPNISALSEKEVDPTMAGTEDFNQQTVLHGC